MAVHINEETGKSEWFKWIKDLKEPIVEISSEMDALFNKIKEGSVNASPGNITDKFFKDNNITQHKEDLEDFFKTWDGQGDVVEAYKQHMISAGKATTGFGVTINKAKGLVKSFGAAMISMGIMWLIGEVISGLVALSQRAEEARQKAIEAGEETTQSIKDLDSLIEKYQKLGADGDLNNSDREQAYSIQEQINELLGDEVSYINLSNGKYKDQIELLKQIRYQQSLNNHSSILQAYEAAEEELKESTEIDIGEGMFGGVYQSYIGPGDESDEIYNLLTKHGFDEYLGVRNTYSWDDGSAENSYYTFSPDFSTPEKIIETYEDMTELSGILATQYEDEVKAGGKLAGFYDQLNERISKITPKLEVYKKAMDSYELNKAVIQFNETDFGGITGAFIESETQMESWIEGVIEANDVSVGIKSNLILLAKQWFPQYNKQIKEATDKQMRLNIQNQLSDKSLSENIDSLEAQAATLGITKGALIDLILSEINFNEQNLSVSQKVSALKELAIWAGIAKTEIDKVFSVTNSSKMVDKEVWADRTGVTIGYGDDDDGTNTYTYKGIKYKDVEPIIAVQADELISNHIKTITETDFGGMDDPKTGNSKTNDALDSFLTDAERRYKIHQNEVWYIKDLNYALKNLVKTEEERLDIEEKIKEATLSYSDNVIKDLEHRIDLEHKLYGDSNTRTISEALSALGSGGNVNLNLRPVIDTADLNAKGWDAGDGLATVFTSTISNSDFEDLLPENTDDTLAINFTPIIVDPVTGEYKGVLTEEELYSYAHDVIAGVRNDDLNLQIGAVYTGDNAIEDAMRDADEIHSLHERIIDGISSDTLITIDMYNQIQEVAHDSAEAYREYMKSLGYDAATIENTDEIQNWQKTWWDAEENKRKLLESQSDKNTNARQWEADAYERSLSYHERLNKQLENELENLDDISEKYYTLDSLIENTESAISINAEKRSKAGEELDKLFENPEFKTLTDKYKFNPTLWLNADGSLNSQYKKDLSVVDESDVHLVEEYAKGLEIWKRAWVEADDAITSGKNSLDDYYEKQNSLKIDTFLEAQEEAIEILDFRYNKETAIIEALRKQNELKQEIREKQTEINTELEASRHLEGYLDENTREGMFNDEDYSKLSKKLNSVNREVTKLYRDYRNEINNLSRDEWYKEAEITAQFQARLDVQMETYELLEKELELTKERTKLENISKQRNTRVMVAGRWVQTADPKAMYEQAQAVAQAEAEKENITLTNAENATVRAMEAVNNATNTQKLAMENNAKMIEDMTDVQKAAFARTLPPIETLEGMLTVFGGYNVPMLNNAVADVIKAMGSFTGKEYDTVYSPTTDYMSEMQDIKNADNSPQSIIVIDEMNGKRDVKIDDTGSNYEKISTSDLLSPSNSGKHNISLTDFMQSRWGIGAEGIRTLINTGKGVASAVVSSVVSSPTTIAKPENPSYSFTFGDFIIKEKIDNADELIYAFTDKLSTYVDLNKNKRK